MADEMHKQYELLVTDTAKLSDRRQTINALYLSANSVLLGGIALLAQQGAIRSGALLLPAILIALAGIPVCLDWRKLVRNYKELLNLRFELLRQIEALPGFGYPIKTYHVESDKLYKLPSGGQKVIFGFSNIEINIPLVFIALYIVTIIASLALAYPSIVSQLQVWGMLPR